MAALPLTPPRLGGCGTLEVIPKELRQKIYSFAFDLDEPVTMKICCGPETTVRERGACKKHGAGAASGGRFNILGISKMMRTEAIWVLMTQGKLVLDVNGALEKYLRYYRWSSQRRSAPASPDDDRKVAMWKAASQFRDVKLKIPYPILSYGDPGVYMNDLVEAAFSLCQSWTQEQCVDVRPQRTVTVDLGHLFGTESPFNLSYPDHMDSALDWLGCHYADIRQPDFARIGPDASNNLRRLLSVVSRHRGQSKWTFAAHAELYDYEAFAEGAEWLEAFQAACAGFDLPFENCSPRPYHMPWKTT
ncbi:hypothetical protein E8E12_001657 [Didymella heteroderae]|uniref:Uncharacterized protein n=1 Tax=Didymella heteroderae TaxID=1769908 RepID=A0A9P5BWV1_9PLEO|nr:hypothetical protein E8E12_001657 [Didymella heteroderae]